MASVASGATAQTLPGTDAAPAAHIDNPRPTSCSPVPKNQGGPDNERQTTTGTFPWPVLPPGVDPENFAALDHTNVGKGHPPVRPANWDDGTGEIKLTSARSTQNSVSQNPQELCGVEGNSVDTAWETTTGRPDTVIAVTDSGIEWCDPSLVNKIYLNKSALPLPEDVFGLDKPFLEAHGARFADADPYDLNGSGVLNVAQYVNDPRIAKPYFCANVTNRDGEDYAGISAEDLIVAFGTVGSRSYFGHSGPAGFTEAIAGWNFIDNNNNPYDDVHYDHGTGTGEDATGAANAIGKEVGTCPDCMVMPVRVGESFIAQGNDFARGVLFAVDSGASVVQEALGAIDESTASSQAIDYANEHGVPIIASAADEEAEHANLPANLPGTIVVNSVTHTASELGVPLSEPIDYTNLNGCTNYGANIAVSVESDSCSSEATGKSGGITGLLESEAKNLMQEGKLAPYPDLTTVSGQPVALSSTEVRELIEMSADDIDFQTAALPYGPPDNYAVASPVPTTRYATQPGYDMYTGYGRINADNIVHWLATGRIPPEASFETMPWFQTYDPTSSTLSVHGMAAAVRTPGRSFHWALEYGIGTEPEPNAWYMLKSGSATERTSISDQLGPDILRHIAAQLPPTLDKEGGTGVDGQPETDAFAFTLRLVTTDADGLVGMDRRTEYLHHDPTLLTGTPVVLGTSVDAAPTLAPIGPHGENALIVSTADGTVNAYEPIPDVHHRGYYTLGELPGWPVQTLEQADHLSQAAYTSKQVTAVPHDSIVGGVAVGDLTGSGTLDIVVSDMEGYVYAWNPQGKLLAGFPVHTDPLYSEAAARDGHNRLLPGIESAPALAHLQNAKTLDIVVSSLDRHVYAFEPNGSPVPGWPVLVVDPAEVQSVNPVNNKVTFKKYSGVEQGTQILDTPAIGALSGSGPPDLVVGTGEEYAGPVNVSVENAINYAVGSVPLLSPANSRVYALGPNGTDSKADCQGASRQPDACAIVPGWPASVADYDAQLLPDVADGTTATPALADLNGSGQLEVGIMSAVGPGYILKPNGTSYLGTGVDGKPLTLSMTAAGPLSNSPALPSIPSIGMPIFAPLNSPDAPGISFIAPATSLEKALDAALPNKQPLAQSQLDAWNTTTGTMQAAFPQVMNDLEFIVQPIAADVGGDDAGTYVISGSATSDIRAINGLGQEAPDFPKFTGGWMVNSPSFGTWGDLANQVLVAGTRDGDLFIWSTPTTRCASSGPWPRQHHDLYNTDNLDATGAPAFACGAGASSPHAESPPAPSGQPAPSRPITTPPTSRSLPLPDQLKKFLPPLR